MSYTKNRLNCINSQLRALEISYVHMIQILDMKVQDVL